MFPDVWGVCPHLNCSRDTTWRDANSHCIPGFSFYSSSPPEQDSYSQSPTSYDVEHNDICVISCLMYRQRDTKDYHIRSHRLCEVVFSFWRRQSYLRSGTGLLFQKHMHTTGSICGPRPWLQNLQSPRMAAAVLMFVSMMISRLFFFFLPPFLSDVTWCRSNGVWHWTSQDWNVYLRQEHQGKKQSCCLSSCSHPRTH